MNLDAGTLTKLRAFEAVGRHLSFTRAAGELYVTPAALSHHVRHLEEELGTQLVVRLHRRIALTPDGERLLVACTQALQILKRAVADLQEADDGRVLTVSVAPYFSAKWLTPRLGTFWSRHPDIDLRVHHAYQPADFLRDQVDAGISWGHGRWTNVESTLVLDGRFTAVCSAEYVRHLPPDPSPQDLLKCKLMYEFDENHWHQWFEAAGVPGPHDLNSVQVDDSHSLRRMTVDGQGVALFFVGLIHEDLRLRHLVRLFDIAIDPGNAYYFTRPAGKPMSRKLKLFAQWLMQEIETNPYV
ncbi:LysR substrate-binding domain-containing protein [Actinomadura viridis]|uniref:LysR substrate-binding domain-containing protein n=1 Tax=Actinomadura viridis TaxID=58110 RepID=UPI00367C147C